MAKKDPTDLLSNPQAAASKRDKPEAPVSVVIGHLMHEGGKPLELTTRMTPGAMRATQISFIFATQIKCPYSKDKGSEFMTEMMSQIHRLLVSSGGKGREDLIAALQAGGHLPDAYYQDVRKGLNYQEVSE